MNLGTVFCHRFWAKKHDQDVNYLYQLKYEY